MKNKIVIWSRDEEEKRQLLAIELNEKENQVNIYKFPEAIVTETFFNDLMKKWKNGEEVTFTEGYETLVRPLSVTDDLLPKNLKVDRPDIITRAKAEWHFIVLSSKLYELYSSELTDIKDKVERVNEYSSGLWEEMKGFWNKVQAQVQEKNLFREHANDLRNTTNEVFDKLKSMRKEMDTKFREESKEKAAYFNDKVAELKEKIDSGKSLQPIFEELKKLQSKFTNTKFSRDDRSKIWSKIDKAFKDLKEKKYGSKAGSSNSPLSRLENRYKGLLSAIDRMKKSIDRDLKDKNNQSNRANSAFGQLEAQLREARIAMIDERIASKQVKMKDMLSTKKQLESKIAMEKEREEKRKVQEEIKAKAAEKKAEIKEQLATKQEEIDPAEAAKLAAAAAAIKEAKKSGKAKAEPSQDKQNEEVTNSELIENKSEVKVTNEKSTEQADKFEKDTNASETAKVEDVDSITSEEPTLESKVEEENTDNANDSTDSQEKNETFSDKVEDTIEDVSEVIEDVVENVKTAASVLMEKMDDIVERFTGDEEE